MLMISKGAVFFQAGEEMLRSKPLSDGTFDHNSYSSPDSVNSLKWNNLNNEAYQNVYNYYKGLIAFRQAHPALHMTSAEDVKANITPVDGLENGVLAFHIAAGANGEAQDMFVIFNPNAAATDVALPDGEWTIYVNADKAGTEALGTTQGKASVEPISAMVLIRTGEAKEIPAETPAETSNIGKTAGIIAGVAAAAAAVGAVAIAVSKKRKK